MYFVSAPNKVILCLLPLDFPVRGWRCSSCPWGVTLLLFLLIYVIQNPLRSLTSPSERSHFPLRGPFCDIATTPAYHQVSSVTLTPPSGPILEDPDVQDRGMKTGLFQHPQAKLQYIQISLCQFFFDCCRVNANSETRGKQKLANEAIKEQLKRMLTRYRGQFDKMFLQAKAMFHNLFALRQGRSQGGARGTVAPGANLRLKLVITISAFMFMT